MTGRFLTGAQRPADVNKGGMLQEESYDLLWHSIFEEGEDNAGSFNLIRSGSRLHHVGDDNFTVVTGKRLYF